MRQGKDKQVIDHLYQTVFPKFKKYIQSRNGNIEDAADVFQDAIVLFYRKVMNHTYNEKYTAYGFLFTVSVNRWINVLRKTNKITLTEDVDEKLSVPVEELEETPFNTEKKSLLTQFFTGIGDKCMELLTYSIYQNLLLEDIALRMGLQSADAAKMQVFRCKQKLFKILEKDPSLKDKLKEAL